MENTIGIVEVDSFASAETVPPEGTITVNVNGNDYWQWLGEKAQDAQLACPIFFACELLKMKKTCPLA